MPYFTADRRSCRLSLVMGLILLGTAAHAQSPECRNIQAQLASLGPGDPVRTAEFAKAVQRQRYELDRTVAYAHSIGCDHRQFLFFGEAPPAQCGEIGARINRMRANLAQLQAEADRASGAARRRQLTARFNADCRGAPQQPQNFFQRLFGIPAGPPPGSVVPNDQSIPMTTQSEIPRGGPKAVCVRTCDGGFFPVSYSATPGNLESLAQRCQLLCPNVRTVLYTSPMSGDINEAVSIDGKPYSELPNAGKFQTKFDPSCTCKPPGETWVQALAAAERALGHESPDDFTVTPEKSAEMARSTIAEDNARNQKLSSKNRNFDGRASMSDETGAAAGSDESSGLGPTTQIGGPTYGLHDGETREEIGPNGKKEKVRIIGPML